MSLLRASALASLVATVAGHAAMITPAPRSAHGQKFDAANKCSCHDTGGCYSNITGAAQYCGLGCLGEACLYYQIGCFQGCGTCSMTGKDLYVTEADLQRAGNCQPPEPTLPDEFRSYNKDGLSTHGDWTKVNPWRAPGTAGLGNPEFQPCGVNSGWSNPDGGSSGGSAGPPAGGQPLGANGTDLPPVGKPTVWKSGGVEEVEFSIYANHGGGYAYRLCKAMPGISGVPTEDCFHAGHLEFASSTTEIRYQDNSRAPFNITARTVSEGTYPKGSQWRLNPIPMCNCDQGAYCKGAEEQEEDWTLEVSHRMLQSKQCHDTPAAQCGTDVGKNTCLKCGTGKEYDCETCCPGLKKVQKDGYSYCDAGKGPKPGPPPPSPTPGPAGGCLKALETACSPQRKQGTTQCDDCLKKNWAGLEAAGCTLKDASWCKVGPSPPSPPGPKPKPSGDQFAPYSKTYLPPGVTSPTCPTGLMFNASWPEGVGSGPHALGYGDMPYSMTDLIKVPSVLGRYHLSFRWDCEQTPQVWNSCADLVIV